MQIWHLYSNGPNSQKWVYTAPLSPPTAGGDGHLCPGACSTTQPPQEGFLRTALLSGCPPELGPTGLCFSTGAARERRLKYCLSLGPGWPTFFFTSYSLFDGRLGKKRRGHLNFIHHSTPHWHHAFAIYLKWIKLIFHQQLNASAENSFFVIQICRDLGWADNCKRRLHLGAQNIGRKVSAN